jgi:hypothetical protein
VAGPLAGRPTVAGCALPGTAKIKNLPVLPNLLEQVRNLFASTNTKRDSSLRSE